MCGFNIFGVRAVFSMDACRFFPQRVLVVIPWMGVCRCSGWCLVLGFLVAVAVHVAVAAQAHPQSTQWEPRKLATTPGVWVGSCGG